MTDEAKNEKCVCGHTRKYHRISDKKRGSEDAVECVATLAGTFIFCKCRKFRFEGASRPARARGLKRRSRTNQTTRRR